MQSGRSHSSNHFRRGLQREVLSDRLERLAHRIVLLGLTVVGCAAVVGGIARLVVGTGRSPGADAAVHYS
jgi:hypothetical protein